jgi:hypothetical protein
MAPARLAYKILINQPTNKQTNKQTNKPTNQQTNKQTNKLFELNESDLK